MRRRRGRGEGSVYPRKQDGKAIGWVGAVTLGYTEQGKQRRRWVYGKTKGDVLEKLDRLRADQRSGLPVDPPRERLAEFLRRWLEDEARVSVRSSTYRRYRSLLHLYVIPCLGGVPLGRLTPAHVQGLLADLERAGKSPRLREMVFRTLHRALNTALRWGMVPRNACNAVTKPRVPRLEMLVFTPNQAAQFLQVTRTNRLHALYVLAVTTGMRQGELFGLQWQDVDLEGHRLHVRRQLTQTLEFVEPKTTKARRMIALPKMAVAALREHREQMFAEGHLYQMRRVRPHQGPQICQGGPFPQGAPFSVGSRTPCAMFV